MFLYCTSRTYCQFLYRYFFLHRSEGNCNSRSLCLLIGFTNVSKGTNIRLHSVPTLYVLSSTMSDTQAHTHFPYSEVLAAQTCPTLWDPVDCSGRPPLSLGLSSKKPAAGCHALLSPGMEARVSCSAGRFCTTWATTEAPTHTVGTQ